MGLTLRGWRNIENASDAAYAEQNAQEDPGFLESISTDKRFELLYSAFDDWRRALATAIGMDWDSDGPTPTAHAGLAPLMEHEDNEGSLSPAEVKAIADELSRLGRTDPLAQFFIECGHSDPPLLITFG